jgi:N6-adenosine-specific RNA methylase IME4
VARGNSREPAAAYLSPRGGQLGGAVSDPFPNLPRGHYGVILVDAPWRFRTWDKKIVVQARDNEVHYDTMSIEDIRALPVRELAADNCALFLWANWPTLLDALSVIEAWGFKYKSCAFCWMKAHAGQLEMFEQAIPDQMGMGYWTRANSEPCLLATRGKPKRLNADVRQAIIEPRREHSRKPDCVHGRIERLAQGPFLELFARQKRPGWDCFGLETEKFPSHMRDEPESPAERL